jgi:hypothetical protein
MKNIAIALFIVIASGCSEQAEKGVKNGCCRCS